MPGVAALRHQYLGSALSESLLTLQLLVGVLPAAMYFKMIMPPCP